MYQITSYEIINGCTTQSRDKNKPALSIAYIDALQDRAERLWNHNRKHPISVMVNYRIPIEHHIPWI